MVCASVNLLIELINSKKQLLELSKEDLKMIPVDYLIQHADTLELLEVWSKLPITYKTHFYLQVKLPCFGHYNRPEWTTEFDGLPRSQNACFLCNRVIRSQTNK